MGQTCAGKESFRRPGNQGLCRLRQGGLSVSCRVRTSHLWRDQWTQIPSSRAIPDGLKAADSSRSRASLGENAWGPAGGRGCVSCKELKAPGQCRSIGLPVHFPGELLELNAGGKEPKRKAGRSSGGESVDACERRGRRPSRGRGAGGVMGGWTDGQSPTPVDGPPPSTMKWR